MGFKEKIRKIWSRKLYRRLILSFIGTTIMGVAITIACLSTVIKYSEVESVHVIPPQQVVLDENQNDSGTLTINGTDELIQGKLRDSFIPKIIFKNFNGAIDPADVIKEDEMKFSYERYDAPLPWWLGISEGGLITWSLERGIYYNEEKNVYIVCSIKPRGFNKWYDSVPFLLKITLTGVNT